MKTKQSAYMHNLVARFIQPYPTLRTKRKQLDPLKRFVMFPEFGEFFTKYDSGEEESLVKQVPLTKENIDIINKIAKVIPIIRRYRGPRSKNIHRECHKKNAERVSIYLK